MSGSLLDCATHPLAIMFLYSCARVPRSSLAAKKSETRGPRGVRESNLFNERCATRLRERVTVAFDPPAVISDRSSRAAGASSCTPRFLGDCARRRASAKARPCVCAQRAEAWVRVPAQARRGLYVLVWGRLRVWARGRVWVRACVLACLLAPSPSPCVLPRVLHCVLRVACVLARSRISNVLRIIPVSLSAPYSIASSVSAPWLSHGAAPRKATAPSTSPRPRRTARLARRAPNGDSHAVVSSPLTEEIDLADDRPGEI